MTTLKGKVVLVAGGSRGAGRGIALACAEAGATVYIAARTSREGPTPVNGAPGTIEETAEGVNARGGVGIPVQADLSRPEQVEDIFRRIGTDHGRLDVLANTAWTPDVMASWTTPFWELESSLFEETLQTVAACWWTTVNAMRLMSKSGRGLIAHVTDNYWIADDFSSSGPSDDPSAWRGQILHDVGHECINRLILGFSKSAQRHGVAVVGLNPGFMRTERVLMHMANDDIKKQFRFDLSETPEYLGRAVVALTNDADVIAKNGQLLWVADLANEYGFTDTDGRYIPRFDPTAPMQPFPS